MREDLVKEKSWHLILCLFREAMDSDGTVDFDEGRILSSVDLNVIRLLDYLKNAWEDSVITSTEKANIEFLIRKIEDDAITLAEYDSIVTCQEQALLKIIRDKIEHFAHESY